MAKKTLEEELRIPRLVRAIYTFAINPEQLGKMGEQVEKLLEGDPKISHRGLLFGASAIGLFAMGVDQEKAAQFMSLAVDRIETEARGTGDTEQLFP